MSIEAIVAEQPIFYEEGGIVRRVVIVVRWVATVDELLPALKIGTTSSSSGSASGSSSDSISTRASNSS